MRLKGKTRRYLELASNLAIILVAAVIVGNFVWSRTRTKQSVPAPQVGSSLSLAGVDWKANEKTLLMVMQQGCRYCEESVPFYRKLHEQRKGAQTRMLTVIPGEPMATARYLSDHGMLSDGIINASLDEINVSATPTLLLVDQSGRVKNVWIGMLDENRQKDVMQKVLDLH